MRFQVLVQSSVTVALTAATGYVGLYGALALGFLASLSNIVDADLYDSQLVSLAGPQTWGRLKDLEPAPLAFRESLHRALSAIRYTLTHMREMRGLGGFLIGSFIYNNGLNTIIIKNPFCQSGGRDRGGGKEKNLRGAAPIFRTDRKQGGGKSPLLSGPSKARGGRLRAIASGGAPLDPALEKNWNAMGLTILQGYGLTETAAVLTANTFRERRPGSVGKPLPGLEVRIAPDGEVLAKGPTVFPGCFQNEKKTKEVFTPDGWFRTGDVGELDADGFLFLKGRKKYMFLGPGGQNVYPEDIEEELNKVPGVRDSAVLGLEKKGGFLETHAVLLLEPWVDRPERLADEANKKLASYQRITAVSVWPEGDFPRSATRKVAKEKVMEWLLEKRKEASSAPAPEKRAKTPLMRLLSEITNTSLSQIHPETNIVSGLGLDSLMRIELVTAIEKSSAR